MKHGNSQKGRKEASLRAAVTWIFQTESEAMLMKHELVPGVPDMRAVLELPWAQGSLASVCLSVWPARPAWACYLLLQRSFQSVHSKLLLPQACLVRSLFLLGLAPDLGDLSVGPAGTAWGWGPEMTTLPRRCLPLSSSQIWVGGTPSPGSSSF